MKRIPIILSVSLALCFITLTSIRGQETKTEKKIKIVIDDGTGKKVIIDTLMNENSDVETITVGDGKMIFISNSDSDDDHDGKKHYIVTVTSDDKDSSVVSVTEGSDNVAVLTNDNDNDDPAEKKVIVIRKTGDNDVTLQNDITVHVSSDENSSDERTRFVVAKDGMVVTVEGEDEAKAKELIKVIENQMGVNSKGEEKEVKTETKKSSKK
jgi:hypothetical protein